MSDLAAALMVAIRVHAGQEDKRGEPYLLHVLRVVEAVRDEVKPIAALHDVFEDSDYDFDKAMDWGFDARPDIDALELLTRLPSEDYAEYIEHIARADEFVGPFAREVKLADLRDNLARIPTPEQYNRRMHDERAHVASSWPEWEDAWGSLKARYEKAIAVLEAAS